MIERYCEGKIPPTAPISCAVDDAPLQAAAVGLVPLIDEAMARVEFSTALEAIMRVVSQANRYIEVVMPWKLAKQVEDKPRLDAVLRVLAELIRIVAITLEPFMPSVAEAIWQQLGCAGVARRLDDAVRWAALPAGQPLGPHPVLFPRAETKASA